MAYRLWFVYIIYTDVISGSAGYDPFNVTEESIPVDTMNCTKEEAQFMSRAIEIASTDIVPNVAFIYIMPPIVAVGLVCNLAAFVSLNKETSTSSSTFFLLKVLAVADSAFLIANIANFILPQVLQWSRLGLLLWLYSYPFWRATYLVTVWLMVLLAAERYVVVCHPFRVKQICTFKNAKLAAVVIVTASVVLCTPVWFMYEHLQWMNICTNETISIVAQTNLADNGPFELAYNAVFYSAAYIFVPMVSVVFFNIRLVLALREASKKRQDLTAGQDKTNDREEGIKQMMVVVIFAFILCQTPSLLVYAVFTVYGVLDTPVPESLLILDALSGLAASLNSSINFPIYCIFNAGIRRAAVATFCWLCRKKCSTNVGNGARESSDATRSTKI